jgi:hypothetical protein
MKDFITNKWTKYVGAFVATVTVLSMIWAAADYTEVRPIIKKEFNEQASAVQQNSDSLNLLRFQALRAKQKETSILELQELNEMCAIARELGFTSGLNECFNYELNTPPSSE